MTQQERDQMYIACCVCCTLAECMKVCAMCQFKIGLMERARILEQIKNVTTVTE